MTVVVGVDGAGRTHRLRQLLAAAAHGWWFTGVDGLAAARESLVVVDDAHRLDPTALRALVAAARSGTRLAISRRPTISSPELAELDELVAADGVEVLRPLDRDGVAALLATVTRRPVSPEAAAKAHEASAGMPVVVVGTPDALLARVQRRFAVLPREVGTVARILALRLDLPDEVLAAPLPDGDLATAMRRLREEGLLVPGGERMIPALAEVVLGDLSAPERRALHDTVARAMLTVGADPLATATQLRAARIRTPAAAEAYLRAGERVRFTDPATALSWFDDATDAGCAPAAVAPGRAEASALLGLPVDVDPGAPETANRLAMVAGAATAHDGRAARAADTLLTAAPLGPLLAVPLLAATGRLSEAHTATGNAPLPPSTPPAVAKPDPAATAAATGRSGEPGSGPLLRFALAAIVAAEEPLRAVPLLIEAAEDVERAAPTAVLPDTPHALGAIVAVATGDLAAAEHLLERALARGVGGPAGAERHRLLLAWARMRAGRYDTALAEASPAGGGTSPGCTPSGTPSSPCSPVGPSTSGSSRPSRSCWSPPRGSSTAAVSSRSSRRSTRSCRPPGDRTSAGCACRSRSPTGTRRPSPRRRSPVCSATRRGHGRPCCAGARSSRTRCTSSPNGWRSGSCRGRPPGSPVRRRSTPRTPPRRAGSSNVPASCPSRTRRPRRRRPDCPNGNSTLPEWSSPAARTGRSAHSSTSLPRPSSITSRASVASWAPRRERNWWPCCEKSSPDKNFSLPDTAVAILRCIP
jgi:hypothetical protein